MSLHKTLKKRESQFLLCVCVCVCVEGGKGGGSVREDSFFRHKRLSIVSKSIRATSGRHTDVCVCVDPHVDLESIVSKRKSAASRVPFSVHTNTR